MHSVNIPFCGSLAVLMSFAALTIESVAIQAEALKFKPLESKIVPALLDNAKCTKFTCSGTQECVFREKTGLDNPKGIVLHYTASTNVPGTIRTYYERGVSAHVTVAPTGEIHSHFQNPEKYIAFHAGLSAWRDLERLNQYFLGIEVVNPGYRESCQELPLFGTPMQITGDNNWWYNFTEDQFISTAQLTARWQQLFAIPGRNVVTHGDICMVADVNFRKVDIGPRYDYKRAFEEFNAGYYPTAHEINLDKFHLTDDQYLELLHIYGYRNKDHSVKSFQMHFSPTNISGELNDRTKQDILNLCIDYYNYHDLYATEKLDPEYRSKLEEFIKRYQYEAAFSEFI